MVQKARTGEKFQVKKTVLKSLMATKETLTWVDGTLVTTGFLYINENVTDQQIEDSKKQLAEAKESPALGFIFNTDNVKSEISAISNTMQQFDTAINTGTVDPDKAIPELMEKLKSEGAYDKSIERNAKQYDEFLKNKNHKIN